jgi:bacillithiol biosynthesis cysteine-adding enzyme BshC
MSTECYPIATLTHTTRLYRDFLAMGESAAAIGEKSPASPVRSWYGAEPLGRAWMQPASPIPNPVLLADALERQSLSFAAGPATLANVAKLRAGARAVVTGQQVVLLGGPLYTLLKAATAIARARQATAATGIDHVPIFWLATEDHDLEEADQVSLLTKTSVETLRLGAHSFHQAVPVGSIALDSSIDALLDHAAELLSHAPIADLLRECYAPSPSHPTPTFASAFARLLTRLFAAHGLIVMDPAGRDFHSLGAPALRHAIEHAADLEAALLARTAQLESAGYHAQVLVKPGASLLFLIGDVEGHPGVRTRQPLRRLPDGTWKAGAGNTAKSFTTSDLLAILEATPERLSPNALLRPVFQDAILPTAAYIAGPAEIAYFAQSEVLYSRILGRVTPVLPRLMATLVEPALASTLASHEVEFPQVLEAKTIANLALRLGARAIPIEGKRKIAAVGSSMDAELTALTEYMTSMSADLGRAAGVSASKMRYQMNRLRRMAANFELQKQASLHKHAAAIMQNLYPDGHLQERLLGGVWFLARYGDALPALLVDHAAQECPGHRVIFL